MAFWKYDLFPYLLWGEIHSIGPCGSVYIESYKRSFKPEFILPIEDGQKLSEQLADLRANKTLEITKIDTEYKNKLRKILYIYGK